MEQDVFTIAVDFDNTLFKTDGNQIGEPIWNTINYCKKARELGHTVILWTCRNGEKLLDAVRACDKVGLQFDYVNRNTKENLERFNYIDNRKIWADIYIDDRAVRPSELKTIKP